MKSYSKVLTALIFFLLCPPAYSVPIKTIKIYISPQGQDFKDTKNNPKQSNDGESIDKPIKSLKHAHKLVNFDKQANYEIIFREGLYSGESIKWTKTSSKYTLSFTAYQNETPVFKGLGKSYFILLSGNKKHCTNTSFSGLTIQHYVHYGIKIENSSPQKVSTCLLKTTSEGTSANNIIKNTNFIELGNAFDLTNCPDCIGYGSVDLVTTSNTVVFNNSFIKNINKKMVGNMHAVYLAHDSDNNLIDNNLFNRISGDPVRVRDGSDNNTISNNIAIDAGTYAFVSGWSNQKRKESISESNIVKGNYVSGKFRKNYPVTLICIKNDKNGCDKSSFKTKGNTFTRNNN